MRSTLPDVWRGLPISPATIKGARSCHSGPPSNFAERVLPDGPDHVTFLAAGRKRSGFSWPSTVDPALPIRLVKWARRNGIRCFAELVACEPSSLLRARNLGQKSLADTDAFLFERTGMGWDELRQALPRLGFACQGASTGPEETDDPPNWETLSWDQLARTLPKRISELPLARLDLPTRMRSYCERERIGTLGALLAHSEAGLRRAQNLGRKSIDDTRRAIVRLLSAASIDGVEEQAVPNVLEPTIEDYPDFFSLWRQRIASLPKEERMVVERRTAGGDGSSMLKAIGKRLGVSGERVRQIERAAIQRLSRDPWWIEGTEARLEDTLFEGAVSLAGLATDRWFRHIASREDELRYFLRRFARGRWSIEELAGERWLSHAPAGAPAEVERSITRALHRQAYPCEASDIDALVAAETKELPRRLGKLLLKRFQADLHRCTRRDKLVYTGFGHTRTARVLARVHASLHPITVRSLEDEFGPGDVPGGLIHVGSGSVMAPQNIPGFFAWQERLLPACVALMRRHGPQRQWSTKELLKALAPEVRMPEWLTHWHLAGMLRLSRQVVYLGRLRVSLPESQREARTPVRHAVRSVLLDAGGPLAEDVLRERVEAEVAVTRSRWSDLLTAHGVARLSPTDVGLIERDVPGGPDAFMKASEVLRKSLEARQIGCSSLDALTILRNAGECYQAWTRALVYSVARASPALRMGLDGSISLKAWESARPPGQGGLVREAFQRPSASSTDAVIRPSKTLSCEVGRHGTAMLRRGVRCRHRSSAAGHDSG